MYLFFSIADQYHSFVLNINEITWDITSTIPLYIYMFVGKKNGRFMRVSREFSSVTN